MPCYHATAPGTTRDADERRWLVDAIAQEVWGLHVGGGLRTWRDVDRHLDGIVRQTRREVRKSTAELTSVAATAVPFAPPAGQRTDPARARSARR